MTPGDGVWDEERWEAFLRERDAWLDRYTALVLRFMNHHPPPDGEDAAARAAWEVGLRRWVRAHGLAPEPPGLLAEPDAEALGGAWSLPVYRHAAALAGRVLDWADGLPAVRKDSALVQFCGRTTHIPTCLSHGYALGTDREALGGNIAWTKRALVAANDALDGLHEMISEAEASGEQVDAAVKAFARTLHELRNGIGIHVQDLRARFELGID